MTTPEEFRTENEQRIVRAGELRSTIVRAQSWGQLFASSEEAQADLQKNLIDAWRFYYKKDDPSVKYTVEPHPDGDIHRVIMNKGHDTTYQRLHNGNVVLTFHSPNKPPDVKMIIPSIGNIDHPFAASDVVIPDDDVIDSILSGLESITAARLTLLFSHLKGKPATQGWEDTMLYNGYLPERIGHRLFPHYAVEELAKLREQFPQIAPKP
ncbi:hypothetical protein HYW42_04825 [Candidatus Daviesbacteria bacterium]|nr:hypothetical protein [Candidatus Daviesbacteria bacterium]